MSVTQRQDKVGYCTLCRSRCGTVNTVEGDRLIEVRPDTDHPTGKAMCLKGKAAPELLHSADRQLYPMRRTHPKNHPDPGWQVISWDEALSEVAGRLERARREQGAESVAFAVTTPSGTPLSDSIDWIERFIRLYGSPNTCYATEICNWHKDHAHAFTFGCGMPTADYRRADLILLWGHNPTNTWLAQADAIGAGQAAGARMIVVDPRKTALAGQADSWLRVCPGTDLALAMGLANLLIAGNTFDQAFVRQWSNAPLLVRADNGHFLRCADIGIAGDQDYVVWNAVLNAPEASSALSAEVLEQASVRGRFTLLLEETSAALECSPVFELYARECALYTPQRVEALTHVPVEQLAQAAALIGSSSRVAFHAWSGVGQQDNASQTDRAIACLYALTGSFDRNGGNRIYQKPPYNPVMSFDLLAPEQRAKALGLSERPLGPPSQGWVTARDMYQAIVHEQPYPIRTLMAFGTNLLLSQPDVHLGAEALEKLDFYVHCDLFESPSARYADIFLPVNTPWEREGLRIGFEISAEADRLVQLRQQMVSPRGESRSDSDIVFDLATRLGMGDDFFGGSLEAGWNHMLEPLGLTVEHLRRQPQGVSIETPDQERKYAAKPRHQGFNTPTGLVEFYSEKLLRHGYSPLPRALANDPRKEALHRAFPLVLTSAKNGYFCHSQHRSLASLRRKALHPVLEISAALAAQQRIDAGATVLVTTDSGQAKFSASIVEGLHPSVVVGEYGWWQRCEALGQDELPVQGRHGSNFNSLVSDAAFDPISGSSPLRAYRCTVQRDTLSDDQQCRWEGLRLFTVTALTPEAADVTTVSFEASDGGAVPDFQPGQHITLELNTPDEPTLRSYSMTGRAQVQDRRGYQISVRRAMATDAQGSPQLGLGSGFIHDQLKVGDTLLAHLPSGHFILPLHSRRPLLLIASGIGITPFLNLLESLHDQPDTPSILLLYGNRNGETHAFKERLKALAHALPKVKIVNFYSLPAASDRQGEDYDVAGRVSAEHVPKALLRQRPLIYLCGAAAMMAEVGSALLERGVPRFDIQQEAFKSPVKPVITPGQAHDVTFSRSGITARWTSDEGPLLTFAEKLGVRLPSGCRVGQCESCAVTMQHGQVMHLHGQEPDTPSTCLACQAIPSSALTLDA
ncbi:molybdopterin-dependent oxidoreductase [Xanthomonas sp. WHRI 1810A]|uniref:molybdopterin-dependent oxidoreductase n=1 Tax=Xanthomonas sp. WHRI 1810A TaxID=3161565 RepID=UPI0032E8A92A